MEEEEGYKFDQLMEGRKGYIKRRGNEEEEGRIESKEEIRKDRMRKREGMNR